MHPHVFFCFALKCTVQIVLVACVSVLRHAGHQLTCRRCGQCHPTWPCQPRVGSMQQCCQRRAVGSVWGRAAPAELAPRSACVLDLVPAGLAWLSVTRSYECTTAHTDWSRRTCSSIAVFCWRRSLCDAAPCYPSTCYIFDQLQTPPIRATWCVGARPSWGVCH